MEVVEGTVRDTTLAVASSYSTRRILATTTFGAELEGLLRGHGWFLNPFHLLHTFFVVAAATAAVALAATLSSLTTTTARVVVIVRKTTSRTWYRLHHRWWIRWERWWSNHASGSRILRRTLVGKVNQILWSWFNRYVWWSCWNRWN